MAAGKAGFGTAFSVISGDAWAVLVRAGREGQSSPYGRTLSENAGASW